MSSVDRHPNAATGGDDPQGAVVVKLPTRIYGDDAYPVWYRRAFPYDHPRARFAGFRPETVLLREGEVRTEGALPLGTDILIDRDVAVTLRDGTVMYTDVLRPVAPGPYPAIVAWSPYGKNLGSQLLHDLPHRFGVPRDAISDLNKFEGPDPAYWVAQGYVVLQPDVRGSYRVGGHIGFPGGRQTAEDGYDFVEWAALQAWSNGRVGLAGQSLLAMAQWYIAAERPPHLAAIAPWEGMTDPMRDLGLVGGIPGTWFPETVIQHLAGAGLVEDAVRMTLEEKDDSVFWRNVAVRLENIEVPAYVVASYDNFAHAHGTLDGFRKLGSPLKWLRIHNAFIWTDFYQPRSVADLQRFFDRYLKGIENGWEDTPPVRIAVIDPVKGDDVLRAVDSWPPSGYVHERLYLTPELTLSPAPSSQSSALRYDAAEGSTGLAFHTRIEEDTELVGYPKLRLWVEADGADDMDIAVSIQKIDATGNLVFRDDSSGIVKPLWTNGQLRVSRRRLDPEKSTEAEPVLILTGEERLSPGEIVPVEISILATGIRLNAGEILRLTVGPYYPFPLDLPFGTAQLTVAKDRLTYRPGDDVELVPLGDPNAQVPSWVAEQAATPDPSHNSGAHVIHVGGEYDSHLLVPLRKL